MDGSRPAENADEEPQGTVLLVEDEENMVRLLKDLLESEGCRVFTAFDGVQAIHVYRRFKSDIDVVLLEIGLPKVGGWDVLDRIKEEHPVANVLVASGYIEPEVKARISAAGVNSW